MRERKPALVITFAATAHAMAAELFCQENGLPGRMIPVPREITAGCGLAWKAPPEEGSTLPARLTEAGLLWQEARVILL